MWISLSQCSHRRTAVWYLITVLYPNCSSCFVPVNTTYLCRIVNFPLINRNVNRGNIHVHTCTSIPFFSGMLVSLSFLIHPESEDGNRRTTGKRKTDWVTRVKLAELNCKCAKDKRETPTSHLNKHHMNIVARSANKLVQTLEKKMFLPKKKIKNKKELRNAGQVYTTCIVLVFLHIVSYFLFTYLKILTGSIFSLFLYVL